MSGDVVAAAALDPTLAALQSALAARPGGVVPFDTATLGTAGAALVTLIGDQLGVGAVVLAGSATITPDATADTLTVVGPSTTPLLGIADPTVTAVFTSTTDPAHPGQRVLQVDLTVPTGSGWTLGTTFPMLATSALSALTLVPASAVLRLRSQPGPADAFGVVEPVGLNLEVSLVVASSPPLASAVTLVPGWATATVAVKGSATTGTGGESLTLRGPSPDPALTVPLAVAGLAKVTLGGLALSVAGSAVLDEDGAPSSSASVGVWGTATLAGTTLPVAVSVPLVTGPWTIGLLPGHAATLTQVMAMLTGVPLLGIVPDAVKNAVSLPVTELSVSLDADRTTFRGLSVVVRSDPDHPLAWALVPGAVELTAVGVGLQVTTVAGGARRTSGWVSGAMALGSGVTVGAMVTLPLGSGPITLTSEPDLDLADLGALTRVIGGGGLAELLPAGAGRLAGGFRLTSVSVTIDLSGELLSDVAVQLQTTTPWPVLPGQLVVDGLMIAVDVAHPLTAPAVSGQLVGTFAIGSAHVGIAVQKAPGGDWTLAVQADHVPLPTVADLATLAGTDVGATLPPTLATAAFEIGALGLDANLSTPALERFALTVDTVQAWTLVPDYLVLESVTAGLLLDWRSGTLAVTGSVIARLEVADTLFLVVSAERQLTGAWILTGALAQPLKVGGLVHRFFPATAVPQQVAGLEITTLSLTADTGDGSYTFDGALTWPFTLGDVAFRIDASATVSRSPDPATPGAHVFAGRLAGSLQSHFGSDQLKLGITYAFAGGTAPVYGFVLGFDQLALTCTLTTSTAGESILTAALTGVSFGDVVTFLVDLVDPSLGFHLSAPWDVLNQIRFDDFSLVANLTRRTIGLTYHVGKDLGLVDLETISLTYVHVGGRATVEVALTGRFLDQTYTTDKPLTWDLLDGSPPAVPGTGSKMLDLKYLGVGQHVVLVDPQATTMPAVLADLEQTVLAAADSAVQPWDLLAFDASSGWLVGARFVVMDTVTLGLVFNDPVLYGVQISLAGADAGVFAGLDFQILYRKVSDSVGVYHIELKLPDAMRHLEFGEVSVTLPVVVLDIYTNGDFAIDFGFPYDDDWTVCFGLEVFPFVGAGGFYFAKLSAATATGLPQITNGSFTPVIELGLALAIGVGKNFSAGPLSAGLSVTVQGVLQGTVAPFKPTGPGPDGDRYYRVLGSIAIVGKLYGTVDFKIITIQISVVAYARATLVVEAYQPILIELSVGVKVTASIKILFIRVHFSFEMHLDASFLIGEASTPPWALAPGSGSASTVGPSTRRRRSPAPGAVAARHPRALARRTAALGAAGGLDWAPVAVLAHAPVPVDVRVVPVLTVSGGPELDVQGVLVPFVATAATSEPATADQLRQVVVPPGADVADVAFHRLLEALLRWGAHALLGRSTGPVTAVDLGIIAEDLAAPPDGDDAFGYANLSAFLGANVVCCLTGPGDGGAPDTGGAALPIMPPLQMTVGGAAPVQFWAVNPVDAAYEQRIAAILAGLAVPIDDATAHDPAAPPAPARALPGDDATTKSLPTLVFDDAWRLLAKAAVQAGADALRTSTRATTATDSLATLAADACPTVAYTVRTGDTAAAIATAFGIRAADLVEANPTVPFDRPLLPGLSLTVPPPTTLLTYVLLPADVAVGTVLATLAARFVVDAAALQAANPGLDLATATAGTAVVVPVPEAVVGIADANLTVPLAAGVTLTLGGLTSRVRAGDTLASIAARFGLPDPTGPAVANQDDAGLLATGATMVVAQAPGGTPGTTFGYLVAPGDTLELITAVIWVRNAGVTTLEHAGWFANAVAAANPGVDLTTIGTTPVTLSIPGVEVTDHGLQPTGDPVAYLTKPGDTLTLVAGYAAALQTAPGVLAPLQAAIAALDPTITPGSTIRIPAQSHVVVDGATLASIADLFGVTVSDLALVGADAQVLAPGATLALPPTVPHTTTATDTLPSLATSYGCTVDHLVAQLAPVTGVLGAAVTVPDARQADLDDLVATLRSSGAATHAAGMLSRFLLHGLQVPDPAGGTEPTVPLATLTGQQFPVATAPIGQPSAAIDITLATPAPVPWLALVVEHVTVQGDTLAGILAQYGLPDATRLAQLNPDVDLDALPVGVTLRVPQPSIDADLTVDLQTRQWPAGTLDPELLSGPARLPLLQTGPVRHQLGTPTPWLAAVPPVLPVTGTAPVDATPSLWPLPPDLLARVAASPDPHPYDLVAGVPTPTGVQPTPVAAYAWGTRVPVQVRRVTGPAGYLPHSYALLGVPQSGRDRLLELWTRVVGSGDTAAVALLHDAPAGSGTGQQSDALDPTLTAVLRTNLSTDTHSGAAVAAVADGPPPAGSAYATLAAPGAFLQQLWECSVTASGGYVLTYVTTGGAGLPDAVFAAGDTATLSLVVLLGSHTGATPDRTLHPFTDVAVVLDALDRSRVSVYAEASDGSDTTRTSTVPPGNVGVELARRNASLEPPDPGQRTRSLAGLLGWTLTAGGGFDAVVGLAVGPTELSPPPGDDPRPGRAAFPLVGSNDDPEVWHFQQVVPVARFASPRPPAMPAGLPPAAADPYAGLGGEATFGLGFRDVFGNDVGTAAPLDDVVVPVGYTDELVAVAGWPGATVDYTFDTADGAARLTVAATFGVARFLPGPGQTPTSAARAAAAALVRYTGVHYQVRRPDLTAVVTTSLDAPGSPAGAGPAVLAPLQGFADAACLFLSVARSLQPVDATVPDATTTLADVGSAYGVTLDALAQVNAGTDADALVAGPLTVWWQHVVAAGDTFDAIAAATGVPMTRVVGLPQNATLPLAPGVVLTTGVRTVVVRAGDTLASIALLVDTTVGTLATANAATPGLLVAGSSVTVDQVTLGVDAGDDLASLVTRFAARGVTTTVVALAAATAALPGLLVVGAVLAVAPVAAAATDTLGVRTATVGARDTLASVASAQRCTVATLAAANAQRTGLLVGGVTITLRGTSVEVPDGATLADLAASFVATDLPVGVADVAAAAATLPGLLVEGATLAVVEIVVAGGEILADVVAAVPSLTTDRLVDFAGPGPAGVYPAGTALTYGTGTVQPIPGQTLEAVAAAVGATVSQLVVANALTPLREGAVVEIPGAVRVDPDLTARVAGVSAGPGATLASVAARLGTDLGDLAVTNATMPGLVVPGVTLPTEPPVTTAAGSTLASLAAAAGGMSVPAFADAVRDVTGLVAAAALVVTDLPLVGTRTLARLAADLGVGLDALARANAPLTGLVRPGAVFTAGSGGTPVTVTATALDTLASVAARFAGHGVAVDAPGLAAANATVPDLLQPTSPVVVPPGTATIALPLPHPVVPAPVFPLEVTLTLSRDAALVDPELADVPAVLTASTPVTPATTSTGGDAPSLIPLATAFRAAFAAQRLELASGPAPDTGSRQVWVLDLGPDGFSRIAADGSRARFFALAPLSTAPVSVAHVPIAPYDPATGTLGQATDHAFQSVDVDAWLATLLVAVDDFLTPASATAAFSLGAQSSLEAVVTAKQTIAGALRGRVAEILVPPGTRDDPAGDPALAAAREALYQSMLVALGTAVSTDAVIDVPVDVSSPFGQPVPVGPADTFTTLAAAYGVTPQGLALGLADTAGLLVVGATVAYGSRTHQVTAADTLGTLATALAVAVTDLPTGLSVEGGGPLFATGTIDAVAMRRTPGPLDSFATVARYLGVDVAACAVANAQVPGLLVAGTVVSVGGATHTVLPTDTLADVAGALGSTPAGVATDPGTRDRAGILSPSVTLHVVSGTDPIAPRVSGQGATRRYRVPAGAVLADLVAHYGVDAGYLAGFLAHRTGLLATGISLGFGTAPPVVVAPGDTPAMLAAHFGTTVLDLLASPVLAPGVALFAADAVLPLVGLSRVPDATDSFTSVAARFGTTVADVATANQDVTGLLVAGSVVQVGDDHHTVTGTDTLASIAAALGLDAPTLAVQPSVAATTGWFDPQRPFHGLQPTPATSVSTARTSLHDGGSRATFLFSTSADSAFRNLTVELDYPIEEIEFRVHDVAAAGGYQSSSWLRPVLPIVSGDDGGAIRTDLGPLVVPLPLRGTPTLPLTPAQTADAAVTAPAGIAEAKAWQLDLTFTQDAAAQDDVYLQVAFGGAPGAARAVSDELVTRLAQFAEVWPVLQPDVARLQDLPLGVANPVGSATATTFAALVGAVAAAMSADEVDLDLAVDPPTVTFRVDTTYDAATDPVTLAELTFTVVPPSGGQGPSRADLARAGAQPDPDAVPWPDVYVAATGDRPRRALTPRDPVGTSRTYVVPPGVAAFTTLDLQVVVPGAGQAGGGLDAAAVQQAVASVMLTRNERLVVTAPTAPEFVSRTPWVRPQSPAVPALTCSQRLPVGSTTDVAAAVTTMLTELLSPPGAGPAPATVTLGCRYAQQLAATTPPLVSHLPVLLVPHTAVDDAAGIDALAQLVAARVAAWESTTVPRALPGDAYVFELSLFGTSTAEVSRPLVILTRIETAFP
ncbi:LysM peptidoglycan-binding domain-containing protein [Cellulomonas phragmiteti]|uniref:LysM domain-containing protein n=1 Tax=Cellulomonas phragmiteti TaxID=478780 RepID=A0ABQ4DK19_9CELL|nr:LysM domain-containing protein [Cellulomonas phragmiteti]GIG39276.1 hypothetical protein Cph01nite_10380 [Cellulomonas phragmiteti]